MKEAKSGKAAGASTLIQVIGGEQGQGQPAGLGSEVAASDGEGGQPEQGEEERAERLGHPVAAEEQAAGVEHLHAAGGGGEGDIRQADEAVGLQVELGGGEVVGGAVPFVGGTPAGWQGGVEEGDAGRLSRRAAAAGAAGGRRCRGWGRWWRGGVGWHAGCRGRRRRGRGAARR